MILELLQRLYHACKELFFSAVNALKTLARVVFDTSHLVGSFIIHTARERFTQFLNGVVLRSLSIFAAGTVKTVAACYNMLATASKHSISTLTFIAKIFSEALVLTLTFIYKIFIQHPTKVLSAATTLAAQHIAHTVRFVRALRIRSTRSLRLAFFSLFTTSKNVLSAVLSVPMSVTRSTINLLTRSAQIGGAGFVSFHKTIARYAVVCIGKIAESVVHVVTTIFNLVTTGTSTVRQSLSSVTTIIGSHFFSVGAHLASLFSRVSALLIQGPAALFTVLQNRFAFTARSIEGLLSGIPNITAQSTHLLASGVFSLTQLLKSALGSVLNAIGSVLHNATQLVMQTRSGFARVGEYASSLVNTIITNASNVFSQGITQIIHIVSKVFSACAQSISFLAESITNAASSLWSRVCNIFAQPLSTINSFAQELLRVFNTAITTFGSAIITVASTVRTLFSGSFGILKEKSSSFAGSARNNGSRFIEKSRSQLDLMQQATRTALAGTAGFVLFNLSRSTISAIKSSFVALKNGTGSFVSWLYSFVREIVELWIIDLPSAIFSGIRGVCRAVANSTKHIFSNGIGTAFSLFGTTKSLAFTGLSYAGRSCSTMSNGLLNVLRHASTHTITLLSYLTRSITGLTSLIASGASLSFALIKKLAYYSVYGPFVTVTKTYSASKSMLNFALKLVMLIAGYIGTLGRLFSTSARWLWQAIYPRVAFLTLGIHKLLTLAVRGIMFVVRQVFAGFSYVVNLFGRLITGTLKSCQKLSLFALRSLGQLGHSTLSYSMRATVATASAGKSGFVLLGKSGGYTLKGIWWSIKQCVFALSQILRGIKSGTLFFARALWVPIEQVLSLPGRFFRRLKICVETLIALPGIMVSMAVSWARRTYRSIATTVTNQRPVVQQYGLIGTFLYVVLVLATTYITPPSDQTQFNQIGVEQYQPYPRALPINTSFELQNITHSKGTFGSVAIKGILSYSYEAGLEAAKNIDNITIEKAESFTLKKLNSHVNHRHIVTTRFLVTATLGIQASTAAAFPFAPTESTLVVKNNALTTHEGFYLPVASSFGTEFTNQYPTKIHLKQNAAAPTETKSPKLIITLEHTGVPAYMLLTLYAIILCLTFMALMSLGALLPQTIKLAVSGVATAGLSIMWILSHLFGLLPTINHLFLTLLMCLAVSLVCVGFNAKYVTLKETRPEIGKTRWTLGLLLLLAVFFTLLIGL